MLGKNLTKRRLLTFGSLWPIGALLLVVAGTVALASAARARGAPEGDPESPALPVKAVPVEAATGYVIEQAFTGDVVARRDVVLAFDRGGRIRSVAVDEGAMVGAKSIVATLDTRHLDAASRRLTAARDEAVAVLRELEAGPRKERIDAARSRVTSLEAELSRVRRRKEREQRLVDRGSSTTSAWDDVRLSETALVARVAEARHGLAELEAGTRPERLVAQKARIRALDAQIADVVASQEDSVLRAPFAGTIVARHVDDGAVVAAGTPVLMLSETDRLEARVGVPAAVASALRVGQAVELDAAAAVTGKVRAVLPSVKRTTRTRTVIVDLNVGAAAVPGEMVRLKVPRPVDARGFWVPLGAMSRSSRGLWSLFVADPRAGESDRAVVERRIVEVVHGTERRAFVRGALAPGDRVVLEGAHRVVPGQVVRLVP